MMFRQGLRFLLFDRTSVSIKGVLAIDSGVIFCFNEPWFFSGPEFGSLIVMPGATLRVLRGGGRLLNQVWRICRG